MATDGFNIGLVELKALPAEMITEAAGLAALAFIDNPCYSYIYQGDAQMRLHELKFLFERNISLLHERDPEACCGGFDNNVSPPRLCCFFVLAGDEAMKISLCSKIFSGLLWIPFSAGFAAMQRLLEVADNADQFESDCISEGQPALRLGRMVVHPDYQGKGI
jgi:hypothetical protein